MKLKTDLPVFPSEKKIDHKTGIYFTGSCFSEHIADKFRYYAFDTLSNSHGVIYNPLSLELALREVTIKKIYTKNELLEHHNHFLSLHHHGAFSRPTAAATLEEINTTLEHHHDFLKTAGVVFITLGTAWIYAWKKTGTVVANCHKIGKEFFTKRILSPEEIKESLLSMVIKIRSLNPAARVVFTVSPVKHLKDGFIENQYSKSLLHVAIQQVTGTGISYFPAYEIMQDDLRDYRFWSREMVHPNELAIDYIWQKFSDTYFAADTLAIMKEVEKVRMFTGHRPLTEDKTAIENFQKEKENKINVLKNKHPFLTWT